jgi:hypothetical protein
MKQVPVKANVLRLRLFYYIREASHGHAEANFAMNAST